MGPLLFKRRARVRMDLNRALIGRRKGGDGRDKMSFFRGGRESSSVQCFSDVLPHSGSRGSAYQPAAAKTATARHFAGNEVSGKLT